MENMTLQHDHREQSAVGAIDEIRALFSNDGATVRGVRSFAAGDTLVVRGWIAAAPNAATFGQWVEVIVDETIHLHVEANVARHDVTAAYGVPNLEHAGFVAVLSTTRLEPGEHTFSVIVRTAPSFVPHVLPKRYAFVLTGERELIPAVEPCTAGRMAGNIETWTALPQTRSDGHGEIEIFVRGWACDLATGQPAADIFGRVGGRYATRAVMGYRRPDVAANLGSADFELCGFRLRMLLPAAIADDAQIEVLSLASDRSARGVVVPARSRLQIPAFVRTAHGGPASDGEIDIESCERLVLEDVLELDRSLRQTDDGVTFDLKYGIDTEAPAYFERHVRERIGDVSHYEHYEVSPTASFEEGLDAVPFPVHASTFIDMGAGKGRTLILAAKRPFRSILGVEINPTLVTIARNNLERVDRSTFRCNDIGIVEGDALALPLPPGDLVVFLYNPFDATILRPIVDRLAAVRNAEVAVVYQ